jgi:uncharacterized protein (UPF0335 family)
MSADRKSGWKSQETIAREKLEAIDRRVKRVKEEIDSLDERQTMRKEMLKQRVVDIENEKDVWREQLRKFAEGRGPVGAKNYDLPPATGTGLGDGYEARS